MKPRPCGCRPWRQEVEGAAVGAPALSSAEVVEGKDIDGDPVFSLRIILASGSEFPVTLLWLHDREALENSAAKLRRFLSGEA